MMLPNIPHLCGGIFFDLLLEARRFRTSQRDTFNSKADGLSEPDIYCGLTKILTGENLSKSRGTALKKSVSNYKKCENSKGDYVPFTDETLQSTFNTGYKEKNSAILERTAEFIKQYLNPEKCKWLVRVLIDIMQKDKSISPGTELAINFGECIPVSCLHEAKTIHFLPFFLSVLHYVVVNCPDCESGRDTFKAWYTQSSPNAAWKLKNEIKQNLGKDVKPIEVIMDLGIHDNVEKDSQKDADSKTESYKFEDKKLIVTMDSKTNEEISSEVPLSRRDTKLLSELMRDFNELLKFGSDTDLTIMPMPFSYPDKFDELYAKWEHSDRKFKNKELNSLRVDILGTLYGYFHFWSCHMWYESATDCCVHKKALSADAWKIEEELQKHIDSDRRACKLLHERLCQYIIDFDIADEGINENVTPGESHTTIIQNQTNIAHSELKTYNIKDSNIIFNK